FLTGLDVQGAKFVLSSYRAGKNPQVFCDEKSKIYLKFLEKFGIDYDNFIRTTQKPHIKAVENFLNYLKERNYIYKDIYKGYYCIGCEQYKKESDLVNGLCPDHQTKPILLDEESYFFKLTEFQEDLLKMVENNEIQILPEFRRNEILEFYKSGLKDISISRKNVKWGIPLPFDKKYTVYVWINAFLNYLTGLGWDGDMKNIPEFWGNAIQFMGKDIFRVHTTIWLGLLKSLNFELPKKFFAHGYFTVDGQKMSKTIGNVIKPLELAEKFGRDGSRFVLAHSLYYGQDTDLSWKRLEADFNDVLVKNLGNLVSRTLKLAEGNCNKTEKFEFDDFAKEVFKNYSENMESFKFSEAIDEILKIVNFANRYIDQEKPWAESCSRQSQIIFNLLIFIYYIAFMLIPFMPEKSKEIFDQLGTKENNLFKIKEMGKLVFNPKKKENLFNKIS
ncbi:MAG: methionine--tRNA ligase, partial [bacterium]|nr:methionine--tRNA ligase [bacterium]